MDGLKTALCRACLIEGGDEPPSKAKSRGLCARHLRWVAFTRTPLDGDPCPWCVAAQSPEVYPAQENGACVIHRDKPAESPLTVPDSFEELTPEVDYPRQVSTVCFRGDHRKCTGKVALPKLRKGNRYVRCLCPVCKHPRIRTMSLKR